MPWPNAIAYREAIQNPRSCFQDGELRTGQVAVDSMGLPATCTGASAAVFKVWHENAHNAWAIKCFMREAPELRQRYHAISSHLHDVRRYKALPFTVEFDYLDQGIRVQGEWYPILKMRWVEGLLLNAFVVRFLRRGHTLMSLADMWLKLARDLSEANIAHADLQYGNALLVPTGPGFSLKLVDYDGMFVPALSGRPSDEVGHRNFRHPRRREAPFNAQVDWFSHLVIYTALRCLALQRSLWKLHNYDENLLFRDRDFHSPGESPLFRELWKLRDPATHALVGHLALAALGPPNRVPFLLDLVAGGIVKPLAATEEKWLNALLSRAAGRPRQPPPAPKTRWPRTVARPTSWPAAPKRAKPWPTGKPRSSISSWNGWKYLTPPRSLPDYSRIVRQMRSAPGFKRKARNDNLIPLIAAIAAAFLILAVALLLLRRLRPVEGKGLSRHTRAVADVALARDGHHAQFGGRDDIVRPWQLREG